MQVACGHVHTLALTDDGRVFAWGNNKTGCVGVSDRGTCAPQEIESLRGKQIRDGVVGGAVCVWRSVHVGRG